VTGRPVVIGVGNPSRCDDGVGWVVAAAAGRRLGPLAEVRLCDGEPARLLDAWTGVDLAVVVDAMRSGAEPGTVHLVATDGATDLTPPWVPVGSHSLGIGQGYALGRAVGRLPGRLVVIGIEGRDHGFGGELSVPVAAAVGAAVELVVRVVDGDRPDVGPATPRAAASRDDEHRDPGTGDHGLAGRAKLAECAAHTPAADHEQLGGLALRDA
jgi:hydrogenase maturation protease